MSFFCICVLASALLYNNGDSEQHFIETDDSKKSPFHHSDKKIYLKKPNLINPKFNIKNFYIY